MALEWWSEQPFPPLTSKNYKEWSVQIKRFLIDLELWEAIDVGLEAMLEKAITEKAQREARARDKRALSILQRGVDDVNFNHLIGIKSARQAWEILRKAHQSSDIEISKVTDGADDDVMSLHRPVQKGATVVCESNGADVKVVGSKSSFGRTNVHHSSGRSDASRLIKPVNGSIVEDAKASQFHWTLGHKVVNVVEVAKTEVKIEIDVEAKVEDATTEEFLVVQRKIEIAEKQKEEGNASFKAGEYAKASQRYEKGAKFIESVSDEEKSQSKVLKISCNLNNAACKLKLKDYEHAEKLCTKVLELDSRNVKALYRRAQAYTHLFNLELAEFDIKKALEIEPDNREVKLEYKTLKDKVKECNKKDAKFYSNIFSKLTKSESGEKEKVKEISKEAEKNEEVSEEKENPSSTASDNVYSHHSSIASDNVSNQVTLSTVLENPLHPKDLVSTQDGAEKVNSSDDKLVGAESVSPFDTSYVTHGGTNIVDDVTSISSSCADLDSTPRAVENLGKEVVGDDIGIIQNVSFEGNCVKELSHDVSGVPNKSLQADIDDDGVTREIAVAEKERASYKEVLAKNDELEEQLLRLKYGAVLRLEADLKRVMNSNEELKAELYEETAYGMGSFDREEIETFGDFCAMEEKLVRSMESEQVCSANSRPVVAPEPEVLTIPDPDLHEFDDGRKQECFSADQLCAMYDTLDEMLVVSKEETISSEEAASEEGKPVYVTEEVDVTKPMVTPDSNEVRVVKSKTVAEDSPILEKLKKKGYEVALFVVDAIDQYASRRLKDCEDEKLVSATKDEKYVVSAENEKASLGYTVSAVSAETVIAKIVCKHIDDTQSVWELKADEARLDRKGLHSDQFYITTNGQVIMASEMELLDVPPEYVSRKESLDPGMTFLVDFEQHIVVNDEALKRLYGKWLKRHELKVDGIENGPALDAYYLKFIVCIPEEHEMHKSSPVSDGTVKVNNHDNEVKFPSEGIG